MDWGECQILIFPGVLYWIQQTLQLRVDTVEPLRPRLWQGHLPDAKLVL